MTREELISFADFWSQLATGRDVITGEDIDRYLAERGEKKEDDHNCRSCKYNDIPPFTEPCESCMNTTYKNWQPK